MTRGRLIALVACAAVSFGGFFAIGRATADDEPAESPARTVTSEPAPTQKLERLESARNLPLLRVPGEEEPAAPAATQAPANQAPAATPTPTPTPAPAPTPTPAPAPAPTPTPTPAPDTGENFDDSG